MRTTGISGLENQFLPARNVNDQGLITLASTYGNDAFPIKDNLIRLGLGADFINDLSEAARKFDAALKNREKQLGQQKTATTKLEADIEYAMSIVRELAVIMRNVYARDPAKLALWESISRVEKVGHRPRPTDEDDEEPTPPAQG